MQARANSLLVALLIALSPRDVTAVRVAVSLTEGFECPPECVECCERDAWFSGNTFKCILKNAEAAKAASGQLFQIVETETSQNGKAASEEVLKSLVPGRTCMDLKQRKSSHGDMWKLTCNYHAEEDKAPKKCSKAFVCCCTENNDWSEDRCLESTELQLEMAPLRNHTAGKLETYEMYNSQMYSNPGVCKRSTSTHVPYDIPPAAVGNPSGKTVHKQTATSSCCLETKRKTIKHTWSVSRMQMGRPPRVVRDHKHKEVSYTVCQKKEQLHLCSDDDGISSNGKNRYRRIPSPKTGTCIGDGQPDPVHGLSLRSEWARECPAPTFGGPWCGCKDHCGY